MSSVFPSGECHKISMMISIGSGNVLLSYYDATWRHYAKMSYRKFCTVINLYSETWIELTIELGCVTRAIVFRE